jgi:predicted nucleic acid-binding protein
VSELVADPSALLVTTDFVIDELLTLLVARSRRNVAKALGPPLFAEILCDIVWVTRDDVAAAWQIFESFDDKTWSFTDCISYAVMQRLGMCHALALDEHFKQFGFVAAVP